MPVAAGMGHHHPWDRGDQGRRFAVADTSWRSGAPHIGITPTDVPEKLDRAGDGQRQAEAEKDAFERLLLEGRAAEVADERRVGGPRDRGDAVVEAEGRQRVANGSRRERYRRASTRT